MSLNKDVIPRKRLSDMVKERDNAVTLWNDGARLLDESMSIVKRTARYGGPGWDLRNRGSAEKQIDAAYWRASFEQTGMTQIMDAKAINQFHQSLERDPPQFSMANIESQYLTMYQQADEMFLRGVYEVFRNLDDSYWTNNNEPYQISKKNIVGYMLDSWSVDSSWVKPRLSYSRHDWINDVDRCVKVLTGRKHQPRELEIKINEQLAYQDGEDPPWIYEDDDYHMKFFKNCNVHWTFKNQDTIDRLNKAIADYCNHHKLPEAA